MVYSRSVAGGKSRSARRPRVVAVRWASWALCLRRRHVIAAVTYSDQRTGSALRLQASSFEASPSGRPERHRDYQARNVFLHGSNWQQMMTPASM